MRLIDKILFPYRVLVIFICIVVIFLYAKITGKTDELDRW